MAGDGEDAVGGDGSGEDGKAPTVAVAAVAWDTMRKNNTTTFTFRFPNRKKSSRRRNPPRKLRVSI
jgi:hypothetical protein